MAASMNEEDGADAERGFLIGTSAAAYSPAIGGDAESLLARAGAGARFLQIRPCFDAGALREYMQKLVQAKLTWNYSVIVTLAPLCSVETARWLLENSMGALVPESLIAKLDKADDPENEGIDLCAGLMREYAGIPGISGVNLLTLGQPGAVGSAIRSSGLRH
jgi:methylenetetrahydrofolate reductase (NADPH)